MFYRKIVKTSNSKTVCERLWCKIYPAINRHEALGLAMEESKIQFKDFDLAYHLVVEFEITPDEKESSIICPFHEKITWAKCQQCSVFSSCKIKKLINDTSDDESTNNTL